MPIIKERISNNNEDVFLKIDLGVGNRLSGYQQEIDELTEETKEALINPVIDNEVRNFKHNDNSGALTLKFFFSDGSGHDNTFSAAGFSDTEIESKTNDVLNSFFILDFFDSFDYYTQTKIFTNYLTKIWDSENEKFEYRIHSDTVNQYYKWYVPKSFIDSIVGDTVTGYVKFSFYNAEDGNLYLFYNKSSNNLFTQDEYYVETTLNLVNQTWQFNSNAINMYEILQTNSYSQKVNDAIDNFKNIQQNPPEGAFDPETGTYEGGNRRSSRGSATRTSDSSGDRTVGDRDLTTTVPRGTTTPDPTELDTPTDPIIIRPTRPER